MLVAEGLNQSAITERLNGLIAERLLGLLNECDPGALADSRTTLMKSVTFEILEAAHEDVTCRPVRPLVGDQRMQAAIICIWSDPALRPTEGRTFGLNDFRSMERWREAAGLLFDPPTLPWGSARTLSIRRRWVRPGPSARL